MARSQKSFIGIDIGGTKIEGIFYSSGKIVRAKKIPTPKTRRDFLRKLFALIAELKEKTSLAGIGISCAGTIDSKRGMILGNRNLEFTKNLKLRDIVAKRFGTPAVIDNDAHCFLRGEFLAGSGQGKKNLIGLTLGTGVGGAAVLGGKLMRGSRVSAYELGHMVIDRGQNLEQLVSSHAFKKLGIDPGEYQHRAETGDGRAVEVFRKMGIYLGMALANFVNIFDPEMIILGGSISKAGDLLLIPAKKEMRKHVLPSFKKLPPIKISKLKYAACLGAISLFSR